MAKPIRALELHHPMIQFLIMTCYPEEKRGGGGGGGWVELTCVSYDYRYLPGREDCF